MSNPAVLPSFVGLDGTLQTLGAGAVISYVARNGTRQELVLVERARLDQMMMDVQVALDAPGHARDLALESARQLVSSLDLDIRFNKRDEGIEEARKEIGRLDFSLQQELNLLRSSLSLGIRTVADGSIGQHQSLQSKLGFLQKGLYLSLGLGFISLILSVVALVP